MNKTSIRKALKRGRVMINENDLYVMNGYVVLKVTQQEMDFIKSLPFDITYNYNFDPILKILAKGPTHKLENTSLLIDARDLCRIFITRKLDGYDIHYINDLYFKLFKDIKDPIIESRGPLDPVIFSESNGNFRGCILPIKMDKPRIFI